MPAKKRPKVEVKKPSRAANILVIIATAILGINGILGIVLRDWIIETLKANLGPNSVTLTPATLITYSIVWIVLAGLFLLTNAKIRVTAERSWKWFLLILAIVCFFVGRLESGVLVLIAAIIYLRQKW